MDQIKIKGKVNTAICYARVVEEEAIEQIRPHVRLSDDGRLADPHHAGCACGKRMYDRNNDDYP